MTVRHIIEQLGLRVWAQGRDQEVREGYVSDLLSDAIAHADEGSLWITVQRHINVVAVAQLKKIAGIIISRGLEPEAGLRPGRAGGHLRARQFRGLLCCRRKALRAPAPPALTVPTRRQHGGPTVAHSR